MGQAGDPIRAARGTADGVQLGSYLVSYLVGWLVDCVCRPLVTGFYCSTGLYYHMGMYVRV